MKREPTRKQEMVDERKLLSEQLKQLEQKEKRIKAAYQNGIDTLEEYKENKELLRNEQKQLELRLSDYQPSSPANFPKKEQACQKLHTICDVLFSETFSDSQKNEVLRSIIQKMVYDKPQDVLTITTISQIRKILWLPAFQAFACRFHKDDPMGIESAWRPRLFPNRNSPLLLR